MKTTMKLIKLNNKDRFLTPHDRPFFNVNNVEITEDINEANYILLDPNPYIYLKQITVLREHLNKCVVWVNNDNPDFLDDNDGVGYKFVAQPSGKKLKYTTVPLIMTDHVKWHLDDEFIKKCRNQEKIYDYCFMGQIYGKRNKLTELKLDNYLLRRTGSIYIVDEKSKHESIEKFLLELSKCKFSFTPRGTGSNSFRLYESLMVGTVPISTDVIEYPFEKEADWDSFSIRGTMDNIYELINKSKEIDYISFQSRGVEFWDNNVKIDKLYPKIVNKMITSI
jgi:hypothetical protein